MKVTFAALLGLFLMGCAPSPASKAEHKKGVLDAISKAGGESNVLNESRVLFARLSHQTNDVLWPVREREHFEGFSGITNLGDVFRYEPSQPDRVYIRVHNSHFDTYFILLVNPDLPQPPDFERIAGNVGFIEPGGAANRGQPVSSETNRTSPAAGHGG